MRILREGMTGTEIRRWQHFLLGQGFEPGVADGIFGPRTRQATLAFQRQHGLVADGIVGIRTLGQAMLLGFEAVAERVSTEKTGPNWPPKPDFKPLTGTAARQRVFGKFRFEPRPVAGNPENIRILGDWEKENIVTVHLPQLQGVRGAPASGRIRFHRLAADQLVALWAAWEAAGLLDRVLTWAGSYVPRLIRGSRTALSNHAFGTAFDINVAWNPLGAQPALVGRQGCVRELVPLANEHGFYWGGHFSTRPDGMHFEVTVLGNRSE